MKITINNFKSIRELRDFDFLPLNVLAGVNSGGKSSLTQMLLLLKQTLEADTSEGLFLEGRYVRIPSLTDFVYGKNKAGNIGIELTLHKEEIINSQEMEQTFPWLGEVDRVSIEFTFHANDSVKCHSLALKILSANASENIMLDIIASGKDKGKYKLNSSNADFFGIPDANSTSFKAVVPTFQGLFPTFIETGNADTPILNLTIMKMVKTAINNWFSNLKYIGPTRVSPMPIVSYASANFKDVGIDGQHTRFILHQKQNEVLENGKTLLSEVKHWICDQMKLAQDLSVVKDGTNSYRIRLTDNRGEKVELYQVGFGVSQVLPIIVQGLLTPRGGMFIVDAPEVHMHPSVQGTLLDFFAEMSCNGRSVLVETHSDHIVIRTRRRLAEHSISPENVNLCYVTNGDKGSEFRTITIDSSGNIRSSLPTGFLDVMDEDFRSIVKAKLKSKHE